MEEAMTLRSFEESDIDDMMSWVSNERAARFSSLGSITNKEDGIKFMKNTIMPHPWFKVICVNNVSVGVIFVTPSYDKGRDRTAALGCLLSPTHSSKGIGPQAAKLVLSTIFHEWKHLERLEAVVDVRNVESQKAVEKAGFKREGVLRKYTIMNGATIDTVMYSFLPTDDHIITGMSQLQSSL